MSVSGSGRPPGRVVIDPATGREIIDPPTRPVVVETASVAGAGEAYERGRADALRDAQRVKDDVRVDARPVRRRGGVSIIALIVMVLALIGAAWLFFAAKDGSFASVGAKVDSKVAGATDSVRGAAQDVKTVTGQAVENAGDALKNSGEKIKKP